MQHNRIFQQMVHRTLIVDECGAYYAEYRLDLLDFVI